MNLGVLEMLFCKFLLQASSASRVCEFLMRVSDARTLLADFNSLGLEEVGWLTVCSLNASNSLRKFDGSGGGDAAG
jgi:hypothetical protein